MSNCCAFSADIIKRPSVLAEVLWIPSLKTLLGCALLLKLI